MLEKYSKTKSFMFIRKRKAARRKRKLTQDTPGEEGSSAIPQDEEEEGEGDGGADRDAPSYREHAFTFQSFEKVSPRT
jgi:replication fork protection complex subunit Tof1/Swi1